jgi:hypothetical protein
MPTITPKSVAPSAPQTPTPPNASIQPGQIPSARERAIAKLMTPPPGAQTEAVINPTRVSPEEMSAILPKKEEEKEEPKAETESVEAQADTQKDTNEASEEEASKEVKVKADPLSTQYAILARKEKALRARDQELKAREQAYLSREEAVKAKEAEYQSGYISKDAVKQNPLLVLSELGLSYDDITNQILNQPRQDPATQAYLQRLEAEIKALKGDQENTKKSYEEQQKNSYQQAVNQIRNEAKSLVNSDPAFEMIKTSGAVDDVVSLIEETFKADGVLLTVEEAAKEVEDYLIDEAIKLAKSKKVQQRLAPVPAPKQAEAAPKQSQPAQMKTLTNSVGNPARKLSARERAIAAFKGELKD